MTEQPNISHSQLITLYQISEKINSQLNVQKLLEELMDLAVELLTAEKGLIFLRDEESGKLKVKVARHFDKSNLQESTSLSQTIIEKVEKSGKPVLLKSIPDMPGPEVSSSVVRYKLKSLICVPLKSKNNLIGIIYLDTREREHFFTEEHLGFLEGFANLAGVAIENATTYQHLEELNNSLEDKVTARTKELQGKNKDLNEAYEKLKNAQLQLIRTEKMASLGQLVAGIAHEINTPLGAITSNTGTFLTGFEKIKTSLGSHEGNEGFGRKVKLMADLARVNKTACERINTIVKSLKNFARLDEEELKTVDLHEGIESTLALVAHLNHDHIEIIKDYGEIPKLKCYASQLNQVFMNLLVNAYQAIDRSGKITIKTRSENDRIRISFSDTGMGIEKETLSKIFDPGFTTKGVGIGTGLGLSISYKIATEHNGSIDVESKKGQGSTFTVTLPLQIKFKGSKAGNE